MTERDGGGSTVRVDARTYTNLKQLAQEGGHTMQDMLGHTVEAYRRQRILDESNRAYARIMADPEQKQELLEERAEWSPLSVPPDFKPRPRK